MSGFSQRLPARLDDNALARALAARRAAGRPVLDLTLANPTHAGLSYPFAEISAALALGAAAPYAPDPRGLPAARAAIAHELHRRHRAAADPGRLVLTAGTSEAYGFLFKLLGDAGAEVLAPAPSYPLIEHLAALEGWRTLPYPLRHEPSDGARWTIDFDALAEAVSPRTRAVVVIHPHNPTGAFVHAAEAHALAEFCAARSLALIADEVFLDYPATGGEPWATSFAAEDGPALTFTLGGLSKACGMPQLKLAWIHLGGPANQVEAAQARLEFIADAYLTVATPVQAACARLLEIGADVRAQIAARIEQNYAVLAAASWPEGFRVLPREAGWSALLRRPAAPDEEALARQLLERTGVLAHPGHFYDFAAGGWHILSLLPEPAEFRAAIAALREWLPRLV